MIYFLLPNVHTNIYKHIDCKFSSTPPEITISNSLSHYLFEIKNKIKQYENDWNDYKKYTNPYEFINTIIPGKNRCVSKYKPLSRSYFKMIEILNFLLYNQTNTNSRGYEDSNISYPEKYTTDQDFISINLNQTEPIKTFHLAEGPGGFIEATVNIRNCTEDIYYGMTILDDAENCKIYSLPEIQEKGMNVPGWKKTEAFLRSHPNIILEHSADRTGNILSLENFLYCRDKYGGSMDFITADGGFDFSVDFNNQEMNIGALLFAQVCYAVCLQKQGGHFVLKVFDCFMDHTVDILYILSSFYEKVYITKPQTSRYANSEKYIICKNFILPSDEQVFPFLKNAFEKMLLSMTEEGHYIHRFLNIPVPIYYIYKLEEYNAIFGQQQIENIYQTMILIENTGNHRNSRSSSNHHGFSKYTKKQQKNGSNTADISCSPTEDKLWSREYECDPIVEDEIENTNLYDRKFETGPLSKSKNKIDTLTESQYEVFECGTQWANRVDPSSYPKIDNLIRTNIQKCIQWCIKHNISYYDYKFYSTVYP